MHVKIFIIVFSLFCLLVDPVLADTLQVTKVYRDYPGYINPAVCENPNVSKSPAAPTTQKTVVPVPSAGEPAASVPASPAAALPTPVKSSSPQAITAPAAVTTTQSSNPGLPSPMMSKDSVCDSVNALERSDDPVDVPYLMAWAGMVATHDVDVKAGDTHGDVTVDNGYAGGLAVGYDFGPARLEIEGSYHRSNTDLSDATLRVKALMANAYADFKTGGMATPYLGAGVGVAEITSQEDDDQVLAGQVAAGVLFAVTEQVAIDLGYRFMMTDDPEINGAELEVRQHTALLGVQIRF